MLLKMMMMMMMMMMRGAIHKLGKCCIGCLRLSEVINARINRDEESEQVLEATNLKEATSNDTSNSTQPKPGAMEQQPKTWGCFWTISSQKCDDILLNYIKPTRFLLRWNSAL
jgi:predicted Fe-S protein YdhL (DUF1289 family)